MEPARLEGANGGKDLQGQAVERLEVGWESGGQLTDVASEERMSLFWNAGGDDFAKRHK